MRIKDIDTGLPVTWANSNNVSFGTTGESITATVTVATSLTAINISAGTTSNNLSAVTFSNSNNVSFGLNASTVTASYNFNLSAGTTSNNLNAVTFSNSNGISFGLNASTVTAALSTFSYYNNGIQQQGTTTLTVQASTSYVFPFQMQNNYSLSYLRFPISASVQSTTYGTSSANTAYSASLLSTVFAVVYSLGTGGSSRSLQSVASGSAGISQQWSISQSAITSATSAQYTVTFNVTVPSEGGSNTVSTTQAISGSTISLNSGSLTSFTGLRYLDVNFATSLPPGDYWMAFGISSTSSTQGTAAATGLQISISNIVVTQANNAFNQWGGATNSSNAFPLGLGSVSTSVISTTASIALSVITSSASLPLVQFEGRREH